MTHPEGVPEDNAKLFVEKLDRYKKRVKAKSCNEYSAYGILKIELNKFNLSPENYEAWVRFIVKKLGV